jgi:D-alanine transfer protein
VPHLLAATFALLLLASGLAGGLLYARWLEREAIQALAAPIPDQKLLGAALQREAFRHPELMPVYGSSEIGAHPQQFRAQDFFRDAPTGFRVFAVGRRGVLPAILMQQLASVGSELRGKKLAIVLSPGWFFLGDAAEPTWYAGNFSRLQARALAFSLDLSVGFKQDAARRILQRPETLESDPTLRFALRQLASGDSLNLALYYATLPLGWLETFGLELQDHFETVLLIQRGGLEPPRSMPANARPDWDSLEAQAERLSRESATNNRFGFDNVFWLQSRSYLLPMKGTRTDGWFYRSGDSALGYSDLDLLLRELDELGAEPLLLSIPIAGSFYDYTGVDATARRVQYGKLRALARRHGDKLLDFADHDEDVYFVNDWRSHLSEKGWLYFDRALDAFYHAPPASRDQP